MSEQQIKDKRALAEQQRMEKVRELGLRPLDAKWADPEVQKMVGEICHEMALSEIDLDNEDLPPPEIYFYLREPTASDPAWLVAAWYAHSGKPRLLKQVATPEEALHEMQQVWRAAVLDCYVGGDDEDDDEGYTNLRGRL